MSSSGNLSEIARVLLAGDNLEDPVRLREVAGLLALLDLLGIVDSFFSGQLETREGKTSSTGPFASGSASDGSKPSGATASGVSNTEARTITSTSAPVPATASTGSLLASPASSSLGVQPPLDLAHTLTGLLSLASKDLPPQAGGRDPKEDAVASVLSGIMKILSDKEDGLDPRLITLLLKMMSAMPRAKAQRGAKQSETGKPDGNEERSQAPPEKGEAPEGEPPVESQSAESGPDFPPSSSPGGEAGNSATARRLQETTGTPGPDPMEMITLFLNFLAGLDLGKPKTVSPARGSSLPTKAATEMEDAEKKHTRISVTSDGKTELSPLRRIRAKDSGGIASPLEMAWAGRQRETWGTSSQGESLRDRGTGEAGGSVRSPLMKRASVIGKVGKVEAEESPGTAGGLHRPGFGIRRSWVKEGGRLKQA